MSGSGIIPHISRILAAAYCVPDKIGDVVTIVSSLGIVASASRNDVGDYSIVFRAPGLPVGGRHEPIPSWALVGTAGVTSPHILGTFVSATELVITIADANGPQDIPFTFLILSSEREGGQPLPAPGT